MFSWVWNSIEIHMILIVYKYTCTKIYLNKIDIELCKLLNKFKKYQSLNENYS